MSILLSDFKSIIRGLPPRPRVGDSKAEEEKEFLFDSETRPKNRHIHRAKGRNILQRNVRYICRAIYAQLIKYIHSATFFIYCFHRSIVSVYKTFEVCVSKKDK